MTDSINKNFKNKDIISLVQFDRQSIKLLFNTAKKITIKLKKNKYFYPLKNKVIGLLFFEPSTRTFSSFVLSVKRLGGITIEYQNPMQTSSAVKGETLEDTIRVFENYCDLIVMRHFLKDAAKQAADVASIPIVNAGDGTGEHPTQALLDLYTIFNHFGRLDNLTALIAGDLCFGRTVHSLLKGLAIFNNNTVYLLSPPKLRLPEELKKELGKKIKLIEIESEKEITKDCDFWYWTRVQKERFKNPAEYEKLKNRFVLTPSLLSQYGNKKLIILHPLPRVGEIDTRIDTDPRALYLSQQIKSGVKIRMALLSLILS